MTHRPRTFVVIPARNEEAVLGDVLDELARVQPRMELVVVDDGSTDHTRERASNRGAHVLQHIVNIGQGASLRTGFDYALEMGAEIVVTFDADGQMDPQDIEAIVEPIAIGDCDVVLGTRFATHRPEGMKPLRRILLRTALRFTRMTTRLQITDVHNGFRAFSRKAVGSMNLTQNRMAHASEIVHEIARLGLRFKEVPVRIRYTEYSSRKGQSAWGALDILVDLLTGKR
jgi:glycosyltransferase involved in cell wall biosynthesis